MAALVPRWYQEEAVTSLFDYFAANTTGNPVVAMPTGTGKALVIAIFLQRAFAWYAGQKVLVATHVKELVDQNYKEFLELWPNAPAGIYSAGLKRKDTVQKIIFCGIASINKNIAKFGKVDLLIIDECHLLSQDDESMYLKVIAALMAVNPRLRVIGLTATPWRAGQGRITDDGIFTDICYNITDMESFNRLVREGYLAPLIPRRTSVQMDVSGVHIRGGEFVEKELQEAAANDQVTFAALQEAVAMGQDRHSWLVFGTGIAHVEKIVQMLNYLGISARCVHSKMSSGDRDKNIADWKAGKFTAMVNNGVLTTGLNHKPIDFIIMLRATSSTVLWVQMLGRGTRPYDYLHEAKEALRELFPYTKFNCLVADFAGNTQRLGPINDPVLPRKRGEKTGEVPIKLCDPGCGTYNHISARFCGGVDKHDPAFDGTMGCGEKFIFQTKLETNASTQALIKTAEEYVEPLVVELKVDHTEFARHRKAGKPDSVKFTYWCGMQKYTEYILFEHEGFGARKARHWWRKRSDMPCPSTTNEGLELIPNLPIPTHIKVWVNAQPLPQIQDYTFPGVYEQEAVAFNLDDIPF